LVLAFVIHSNTRQQNIIVDADIVGSSYVQDIYNFHDVTEGSVLGVQDLFTHIGVFFLRVDG